MIENERVIPTPPARLCIVNEQGEYFTVRLTGVAAEPTWTPFRVHAYTYGVEAEAVEIASRFGGTVRPYDTPSDTKSRGGVVVPFVRPARR